MVPTRRRVPVFAQVLWARGRNFIDASPDRAVARADRAVAGPRPAHRSRSAVDGRNGASTSLVDLRSLAPRRPAFARCQEGRGSPRRFLKLGPGSGWSRALPERTKVRAAGVDAGSVRKKVRERLLGGEASLSRSEARARAAPAWQRDCRHPAKFRHRARMATVDAGVGAVGDTIGSNSLGNLSSRSSRPGRARPPRTPARPTQGGRRRPPRACAALSRRRAR